MNLDLITLPENPKKKMQVALRMAASARSNGEIPIGAAIFRHDTLIASAHNLCETKNNPTLHAELIALSDACEVLGTKYLSDCELYVTLEPCLQCAGAIQNSRMGFVVFGAYDLNCGACVSAANINSFPSNWKTRVVGGICEQESKQLLDSFFDDLRNKII